MSKKKVRKDNGISERAQHFLKVLVERYIQDGQPVGSQTLVRDAGTDLSPATVRSVVADLEEMGLVTSPHTSAGRVPTVSGYRLFVDSLLTITPLEKPLVGQLKAKLGLSQDPASLVESASQLLSGLTHMAGVVKVPRRERVSFRQIEFLPLSGNRVIAILVTDEDEVHNRIVLTRRPYSAAELEQAGNYLNKVFSGQSLKSVREALFRDMKKTRDDMDRIMARAVEMAGQLFDSKDKVGDCIIAGQTNLMDFDELAQMERLRHLFEAFTEKQQILSLLDECMLADGIQIFIGEESGYRQFDRCSVVAAPYKVDDEVVGVLGVIGPTRMAYGRVIPVVDVTAKLLSAALKQR